MAMASTAGEQRQEQYARRQQSMGDCGGGGGTPALRWPPSAGYLVAPSPVCRDGGGRGSMRSGNSTGTSSQMPEAVSSNDLPQQRQSSSSSAERYGPPNPAGNVGLRHQPQQLERKPWLKPVSSLIRGIQQQQQQQQHQHQGWSGVGVGAGFAPAIHMVPQQDGVGGPVLSPTAAGWRGAGVGAASVVESGTANSNDELRLPPHGAGSFGTDRSRSVSPRIVRGPLGTGIPAAGNHHHPGSVAGTGTDRRLYNLQGSSGSSGGSSNSSNHQHRRHHHRSRSDHVYAAGGVGFEQFDGARYRQQQQHQHQHQQYVFATAAADAGASAVPVPAGDGDATMTTATTPPPPPPGADPYRTPTAAAGATPRFWGDTGESPPKQLRGNHGLATKDQQQQQTCLFRGCPRRPTHAAVRGERPSYCFVHSTPGMTEAAAPAPAPSAAAPAVVTPGRRNRCLVPGCTKAPRYALPGQKAEYCTSHKISTLHVDVKVCVCGSCEMKGRYCRYPTFVQNPRAEN